MIHKYQEYTFQEKAEHDIFNQVVSARSQGRLSMIAKSSRGKNGISCHQSNKHMGEVKTLMMTTTHDVERFQRMSSNSDDVEKKG